jgi:L-lactate dehydrogenase complex protein LldG
MSAAADSRTRVLELVRAATQNSGATAEQAAGDYAAMHRENVQHGSMSAEARLERMAERLREYDAEVEECKPEELAETIRAQLAASGRRTFVVPEGLPKRWLVGGFEWQTDRNLQPDEVEQADGAVTASFCGVAESGTIVLHHSATEGRRVISLLPDWHLCVLRKSQIVETLPEYFACCGNPPALVTWISGPSATADIEMTRIKGVHGPRHLAVILLHNELP